MVGVLNWLDPHVEIWPNGAPQVGDIAEMRRTVTATDIERFTEISGDRNPLHYDLEAAKRTLTRESLASREPGMWKWSELLPHEMEPVSLGESETPIIHLPRTAAAAGASGLMVTVEGRLPTGWC